MKKLAFFLVLLVVIAALLISAGRLLVIDAPSRSDAIVVLAGDPGDSRITRALELWRQGYASYVLVDATYDYSWYGHTPGYYAEQYLREVTGPEVGRRIRVCPYHDDSTRTETTYVDQCLKSLGAKSALLVTQDHHTRRALSVFRTLLPQYRWSVAASYDPRFFGAHWWRHREWAKMALNEWERMIWWQAVDRWRRS